MKKVKILSQPTDSTCGPTCLHAVYNFYDDHIELWKLINEVKTLKNGGTLAVMLAIHALKRGYNATLYSYNLAIFDPSWFPKLSNASLIDKLESQRAFKMNPKLRRASKSYIEFLQLGGQIKYKDLNPKLLDKLFLEEQPILTGLSATYLYNSPREMTNEKDELEYHDIKGVPSGHFVVLNGYNKSKAYVLVADPFKENPVSGTNYYSVNTQRLINSIMLGIVTYDSNLLIIKPKQS